MGQIEFMTQIKTIRLLVLNDSRNEAERLISMLHNAGRPVRAQYVDSEEALNKLLQEKSWDLMIGLDTTTNIKPSDAVRLIRRLNKDVPLVLQTQEEGTSAVVDGMKLGAMDVVRLDEDQHLLQVIQREFQNREERDQRRTAERRHREIERHNQQLLDSSRDAIAFVQDGMFLYVNESFSELLGHSSRDELECMPVIDIISADDQDKVKKFLKEFTLKGSDIETKSLDFRVTAADSSERGLKVEIRKSSYEEELCIQFLVRTSSSDNEELEAQLQQIKSQDLATGLFNKSVLMDHLHEAVDKAATAQINSALINIEIEDFIETVSAKIGVSSTDIVLGTIAAHAKSLVKKGDLLCRFNEDSFMLLAPKIDAETALKRAATLYKKLTDYVVDIDGKTIQFSYSIGVSLITENTAGTDEPIDQALKAQQKAKLEPEQHVRMYEPEERSAEDEKRDITNMVQNALSKNQFKLLFQPILSLRGSDKEHYEVLLRMLDSEGTEISPNEFLVSAARIRATTKIDRWVILESIKLLADHRGKGNDTRLIVNLSRESMLDPTLTPWLAVAFKAAGLPTEAIIFQLNEIDINDHLNVASSFTADLKKLGCECSITRFGCALNPFNALKMLSCSHVKIDGSFTQDLQKNSEDAEALNELVSQLHQEDKITIVPFVENASVLSKLWQSGVHYIQGYYLQGPTDAMNYDFDTES